MTDEDAESCIAEFRATLKQWSLVVGGFADGDGDQLYRELEDSQTVLSEIAVTFPSKAYSVDLLIGARTRPWAGWLDERPARPNPDTTP